MLPYLYMYMHFFLGQGYQNLIVTFNRVVLCSLSKEEAIRAYIDQFGAFYVFGAPYQTGDNGQLLPEKTRNFFDFVTIFLWNIPVKFLRKGSKKPKV